MAYRPPGGIAGGRRIERPVALLDLMRTLCTQAGLEVPPMHQGRDIPELSGKAPPRHAPPVLSELPPSLYALRHQRWKLMRRGPRSDPEWRLFDLSQDPLERDDLAAVYPDTLSLLRSWLESAVAGYARMSVEEVSTTTDPEMLRRLRTLGYIR